MSVSSCPGGGRDRVAGRLAADAAPWIEIRFVDSTYVHVEADDEDVLAAVRAAFVDVEDLPS